ncbi:MAG: hypothetical protein WEB00_16145 [Dehalococcoidia bacterium]
MGSAWNWRIVSVTVPPAMLALASIGYVAMAGSDSPNGEPPDTVAGTVAIEPTATPTPEPEEPFIGIIGDFEVEGSAADDPPWPCSIELRTGTRRELVQSELWFTKVHGIDTVLPHHTICDGIVLYISGDVTHRDWTFYGGDSYYWDDNVKLPFDAKRSELRLTTIAGRPALLQEGITEAGHEGPPRPANCRIAVIERFPRAERPGIAWEFSGLRRPERPVGCAEATAFVQGFLALWAEPWIDPADDPTIAVEQEIERRGQVSAGDCALVTDYGPGPLCYWEHGTSGDQRAYGVSPVEQAFFATELFFLVETDEGWELDHIEPGPCVNFSPCPPPPGANVQVVTQEGDSCARARREPGINAEIRGCLEDGTIAIVGDYAVEADARIWVPLQGKGWVSASYLTCISNCIPPEGFFSCGAGAEDG